MDKFLEMQTFTAVVESGSFVKAADTLNMSKAAVSRHIVELEKRLSARLLHRTTRRLSLTTEGQVFYERSTALLNSLAEVEAEVSSHQEVVSGLLRINAPYSYGIQHLAPLWGLFRQRHPHITLNVTLADRVVDLVEEGYDLAIRIASLESSSLVSRRLASTRPVLCASPGYLRQHGTPDHPRELAQHHIIAYSYLATKDTWQFQGPEGWVEVKTKPWMHSNNGDTCRAVALAGQGVILQPTFTIGDNLKSGRIVEILPQY